MPQTIHVLELPVEVEPLRPGVQRWAPLTSHIVVSAAAIRFGVRVAAPLAELLKDLFRPPVEMGVDDPHGFCRRSYHILYFSLFGSDHQQPSTRSTPRTPLGQIQRQVPKQPRFLLSNLSDWIWAVPELC